MKDIFYIDVGPCSENRAVWERVIGTLTGLVWLAGPCAKLHPLFDRLGWREAGNGPRPSVIRVLSELGDEEILAEARRRFAAFLKNPQSLRPELRETVIHLVGLTAVAPPRTRSSRSPAKVRSPTSATTIPPRPAPAIRSWPARPSRSR